MPFPWRPRRPPPPASTRSCRRSRRADPPTDTRTQGFRLDVDRPLRDLGMTAAHGSNAAGWTVGEGPVDGGSHAILWVDGAEPRDLGDLPGGAIAAVARAVNEAGQVVGRGTAEDGDRAFVWTEEAGMRDLTLLAEAGAGTILRDATDIDAEGRIVGRATIEGIETAFVWTPATGTLDFAQPTRGARQNIVALNAVTSGGAAVGRALAADGRDRPVAWSPGQAAVDLGDLPGGAETGVAHDIDPLGWIVGRSAAEGGDRAFVWQEDSGMIDLNDLIEPSSDVVLTAAVSIIEDGRILAYGQDGEATHFYRLIPVAQGAGADIVRVGLVAEKGAELQTYAIDDLGAFTGSDGAPILAMDDTGRVVGACDLLAGACPVLTDLAGITNLFEEDASGLGPFDPPLQTYDPVRDLVPQAGGPGTPFSPRTPSVRAPSGPQFPVVGGGGDRPPAEPSSSPPPVVPLPASWLGLLAALGLLGAMRRRRGSAS